MYVPNVCMSLASSLLHPSQTVNEAREGKERRKEGFILHFTPRSKFVSTPRCENFPEREKEMLKFLAGANVQDERWSELLLPPLPNQTNSILQGLRTPP